MSSKKLIALDNDEAAVGREPAKTIVNSRLASEHEGKSDSTFSQLIAIDTTSVA